MTAPQKPQDSSLALARQSLAQVMQSPAPDNLWQLRAELLDSGFLSGPVVPPVLDEFYRYLNKLIASSSAREYSHLASILDMAAIGSVSIQNLAAEEKGENWWRRFIFGALSESLMVLAARQYVKAWEEEMTASYNEAAWYLSEQYWRLSNEWQPDLDGRLRRQMVDDLIDPLRYPDIQGTVKAGLIIRLFQVLLLVRLQPLLMMTDG